MFNLFKKYEIYSSCGGLKILINKEKSLKYDKLLETTLFLTGILSFKTKIYESELVFLAKHIDLYKKEISRKQYKDKLSIYSKVCPLKEYEFKLKNLIYIFNGINNLTQFKKDCLELAKKEDITNAIEIEEIYIQNLISNRNKFTEYYNYLDLPIEEWAFSNNSIRIKYHNFSQLSNYLNFKKIQDILTTKIKEYQNTNSLDELINFITENKNIKFHKELKNHIRENLFLNNDNKYFINYILFEKINTIFQLPNSENIKSLKELKTYISKLDSIEKTHRTLFMDKKSNIKKEIIKITSQFQNEPLEVLNKLDLYWFIIKDKNMLLDKYNKTNPLLNIKKEKSLSYFLEKLSKKMSKDIRNFKLNNINKGFNDKYLNIDKEFQIKTVNDFNELFQIGNRLSNCAGNLETIKTYQKSYVFTIIIDNKELLGTIREGELIQLLGYKNSSPSVKDFKVIAKFLKENNYIDYNEQTYKKACIL